VFSHSANALGGIMLNFGNRFGVAHGYSQYRYGLTCLSMILSISMILPAS